MAISDAMMDAAPEPSVEQRNREFERQQRELEHRIRRHIAITTGLCVLAVLAALFPFLPGIRPTSECIGLWFQRGGAVMTALAVWAQSRAGNVLEMMRGIFFAETWILFHRYKGHQRTISGASIVLVISGTLIWGYGDLLIASFVAACSR